MSMGFHRISVRHITRGNIPPMIASVLLFAFLSVHCLAHTIEYRAPIDHMGRLDKKAQVSLSRFLGHFRADFLFHGALSTQVVDTLGGYPFPPKLLGHNTYLIYSFRPNDATNKGAVVITSSGKVLLAALGSFQCGLYPGIAFPSSVRAFVRSTRNLRYLPAIKTWALLYCHRYALHLYSLRCAKRNIKDCPLR